LALTAGEAYQNEPFLIPNIQPPDAGMLLAPILIGPDSDIVMTDMKADKALSILRALFVEAGVPDEQARLITLKSLRKFLATAGTTFHLEPEQLNAVGDWQDTPGNKSGTAGRSRARMPQTYSGSKLELAYISKKWLVSGITHIGANSAPANRYTLSEFLADDSDGVDIKWFTWDHVQKLALTSPGDCSMLTEATGLASNLGLIQSDLNQAPSPAGARRTPKALPLGNSEGDSGLAASPSRFPAARSKSAARSPSL